jgi:hypothetical protein
MRNLPLPGQPAKISQNLFIRCTPAQPDVCARESARAPAGERATQDPDLAGGHEAFTQPKNPDHGLAARSSTGPQRSAFWQTHPDAKKIFFSCHYVAIGEIACAQWVQALKYCTFV